MRIKICQLFTGRDSLHHLGLGPQKFTAPPRPPRQRLSSAARVRSSPWFAWLLLLLRGRHRGLGRVEVVVGLGLEPRHGLLQQVAQAHLRGSEAGGGTGLWAACGVGA